MGMNEQYLEAAKIINSAGGTPLQVNETLVQIIKEIVTEEEIEMILAFKEKTSQTMDQLKESSGMPESEILEKTKSLAKKGVIFNQPSSKGVMVYRLLPLVNVGVFEYTFMQKLEPTEKNKRLAGLFTQLFKDMDVFVQSIYDGVVQHMENMPAVDRTVPIQTNKKSGEKIIEINQDVGQQSKDYVLQTQNVKELIEKFDEIAVGHCFCRHHKDMEDRSCKQTDMRENCFTFGKSARFTSEQGFMRMVDKEEALQILMKSQEDGLVHKAFHPNFDVTRDETSICNCCKCCCGNSIDNQIGPIVNATSYLAIVNEELCTGCEACLGYCHTDAISMGTDNVVHVDENSCLGCGVCAYMCPEDAIQLKDSVRIVRIAPPKKDAA